MSGRSCRLRFNSAIKFAEKNDGAQVTSSSIIQGDLRYLEYFGFRLVVKSLKQCEVIMRNAPHLVFPL